MIVFFAVAAHHDKMLQMETPGVSHNEKKKKWGQFFQNALIYINLLTSSPEIFEKWPSGCDVSVPLI